MLLICSGRLFVIILIFWLEMGVLGVGICVFCRKTPFGGVKRVKIGLEMTEIAMLCFSLVLELRVSRRCWGFL